MGREEAPTKKSSPRNVGPFRVSSSRRLGRCREQGGGGRRRRISGRGGDVKEQRERATDPGSSPRREGKDPPGAVSWAPWVDARNDKIL